MIGDIEHRSRADHGEKVQADERTQQRGELCRQTGIPGRIRANQAQEQACQQEEREDALRHPRPPVLIPIQQHPGVDKCGSDEGNHLDQQKPPDALRHYVTL